MKLQQLLSVTRKAVDEFQMIQEGDKIAVGVSGGKDSLTLLYALHGLKRFYPQNFTIEAITVDLGFEGVSMEPIQNLCDELGIHYTPIPTEIYKIIFEDRKESNPCSLCSKMRKGALNEVAKELGCNKVAYGHHKDDVVETMLMSLIYEGQMCIRDSDIHDGMYRVVQTHEQFNGLGIEVAGKTGTAEIDIYHPNHGLFLGYAPASEPKYAIAVRIANGYSSGNACLAANDIFKYIFKLADEETILTGIASSDTSNTSND